MFYILNIDEENDSYKVFEYWENSIKIINYKELELLLSNKKVFGCIRNDNQWILKSFTLEFVKNYNKWMGKETFISDKLCRIIDYKSEKDIDVLFVDDNKILQNISFSEFFRGVLNKKSLKKLYEGFSEKPFVGEKSLLKDGEICEIIKIHDNNLLSVRFQNNMILNDISYDLFKSGKLSNPFKTLKRRNLPERILCYFFLEAYKLNKSFHYIPSFTLSNYSKKGKPYELDVNLDKLNIAIEYDGKLFHQDKLKDEKKNDYILNYSKFNKLIRIREEGCPILKDELNLECFDLLKINWNSKKTILDFEKIIHNLLFSLGIDIKVQIDKEVIEYCKSDNFLFDENYILSAL